MSEREIDRLDRGEWGLVAALSLAGIGIVVGSQLLVAAATVPLWYVVAAGDPAGRDGAPPA
ncbi:hypothetical protein [Natronorubrum sp. FCH18a]|uniref:hypothetical protein n=1 Tax=Natronorubrum sp. FCH18a TaxID=3447018 RepID=UPI003F50FF8B